MIPLVNFSFLYNSNSQEFNIENYKELINELEKSHQIGVVFTISSQEELKDKKTVEIFKQYYKEIKLKVEEIENEKCKEEKNNSKLNNLNNISSFPIELYFILNIQIEQTQFKDMQITQIRNFKAQCDLLMIYSFSNTMLEQIISKKAAHMIVNVFSQKLVNRYDFIHHFNSGINHVLCSEMSQNSMFLGVEISEFNIVSSLKQSKYFSSCIQNSKLATKAKIPHMVFKLINSREDIRSSREIESIQKAFFKAQPFQILRQKQFIEEFLKKQSRIKRGEYIE